MSQRNGLLKRLQTLEDPKKIAGFRQLLADAIAKFNVCGKRHLYVPYHEITSSQTIQIVGMRQQIAGIASKIEQMDM